MPTLETLNPVILSEDNVIALATRRGDADFETVACVSLTRAQIALQLGKTLELTNEVAVIPLPHNEFNAPDYWDADTEILPWAEAQPLINLLAQNQ